MFRDFVNGISYLLKSFSVITCKEIELIPSKNNNDIFKNDWKNIGKDITKAINEFKTL